MNEDGTIADVTPHWLNRFGIEVFTDPCMTAYIWRRFRFVWYDPRQRENWEVGATFDSEIWQIGIGPAVFVYCRDDE